MNPLIQLKTIPPVLITLALICSGLLPNAQAVVPPPDGGYPGFNTAEGQNALFSLTTGAANTAVGWFSLQGDSGGQLQHRYRRGGAPFQHLRPKYCVWRGGAFVQHARLRQHSHRSGRPFKQHGRHC